MIWFTWRWKISNRAREGHRMIIFFHAWLLFFSMHVSLGDRFVSFKADEDRRDGIFFFCRAVHDYCFLPCMWPQVIDLFPSKQAGIVCVGKRTNQNKYHTKKYPHFVLFSCRRFCFRPFLASFLRSVAHYCYLIPVKTRSEELVCQIRI